MATPGERWSIYRNLNLGTTGVLIDSGVSVLKGFVITNASASALFVKFYDSASAPTVGTTTPVMTVRIPAATTVVAMDAAIAFTAGLGAGASTGVADSDTTAPQANDVVANVFYG